MESFGITQNKIDFEQIALKVFAYLEKWSASDLKLDTSKLDKKKSHLLPKDGFGNAHTETGEVVSSPRGPNEGVLVEYNARREIKESLLNEMELSNEFTIFCELLLNLNDDESAKLVKYLSNFIETNNPLLWVMKESISSSFLQDTQILRKERNRNHFGGFNKSVEYREFLQTHLEFTLLSMLYPALLQLYGIEMGKYLEPLLNDDQKVEYREILKGQLGQTHTFSVEIPQAIFYYLSKYNRIENYTDEDIELILKNMFKRLKSLNAFRNEYKNGQNTELHICPFEFVAHESNALITLYRLMRKFRGYKEYELMLKKVGRDITSHVDWRDSNEIESAKVRIEDLSVESVLNIIRAYISHYAFDIEYLGQTFTGIGREVIFDKLLDYLIEFEEDASELEAGYNQILEEGVYENLGETDFKTIIIYLLDNFKAFSDVAVDQRPKGWVAKIGKEGNYFAISFEQLSEIISETKKYLEENLTS